MNIENHEGVDYFGRDTELWSKSGVQPYKIDDVINILNIVKEKYGNIDVKVWNDEEDSVDNILEFIYTAETTDGYPSFVALFV